MQLTARNIGFQALHQLVGEQHARKVDVVLPATALLAVNGQIVVATGTGPVIDEFGATTVDGAYRPTDVMVEHLSSKLGIDLRYLRKLSTDRPDLFDVNVNGWLHGFNGDDDGSGPAYSADTRRFLFRGFAGSPSDGTDNVARGMLSDKYRVVDNMDVLMAALAGIDEASKDNPAAEMVKVSGADVSDRRMFVRFIAPQVEFGVRELLNNYRSPFAGGAERVGPGGWSFEQGRTAADREGQGYAAGSEPIGWAGFEIANSELGYGRMTITPRAEIQVCRNGLKITQDVLAKTHLGERMDEGVIDWSDDTREAALTLVRKQTRDAVKAFLSTDYWLGKVAELAEKAGVPVKDPVKTIEHVSKSLKFTEDQQATILQHFLLGGQASAGGVMNAVTSAAQTQADPEKAAALEDVAVKALALAARVG